MDNLVLPTNEKELKEFQTKVDDMVNAFNEHKLYTEKLERITDRLSTSAEKLVIANNNMSQIIKNIHITLNANNELFSGNIQIEEMMKEISKFVIALEAKKSEAIQ